MTSDLGRPDVTIHDEVVRNRVATKSPGKNGNVEGTDGAQAGEAQAICLKFRYPRAHRAAHTG